MDKIKNPIRLCFGVCISCNNWKNKIVKTSHLLVKNTMDILDRLVELAQVKGSVDVQCLFRGEWYVRMNQSVRMVGTYRNCRVRVISELMGSKRPGC